MYDYILNYFCSFDELKPQFMTPFEQGEFNYATDAYALIKVPKSLCKLKYKADGDEGVKCPNFESVLFTPESFVSIKTKEIATNIAKMRTVYAGEICKKCGGSGVATCKECGNEHNCKHCGGTGTVGIKPFLYPSYTVGERQLLNIGGRHLKAHLLEKLLMAAGLTSTETIKFAVDTKPRKGVIFNLKDGVTVIVMDCLHPDDID